MPDDTRPRQGPARVPCPICGAPSTADWRPFCSRRCADLDLGRWLTGAYAMPVEDESAPLPDTAEDGAPGGNGRD